MTPTYRRPRRSLTAQECDALVAMRDASVTWREIGKVFGKQDNACKRIYDRTKQGQTKQGRNELEGDETMGS